MRCRQILPPNNILNLLCTLSLSLVPTVNVCLLVVQMLKVSVCEYWDKRMDIHPLCIFSYTCKRLLVVTVMKGEQQNARLRFIPL